MAITSINVTRQVDISYCWYYQTQGLASSPALTVTVKVYLAKSIRFLLPIITTSKHFYLKKRKRRWKMRKKRQTLWSQYGLAACPPVIATGGKNKNHEILKSFAMDQHEGDCGDDVSINPFWNKIKRNNCLTACGNNSCRAKISFWVDERKFWL